MAPHLQVQEAHVALITGVLTSDNKCVFTSNNYAGCGDHATSTSTLNGRDRRVTKGYPISTT